MDHHQLKPIKASEETREPSKRYGLVKEETKGDVADFAFVEYAQYDCRERYDLTSVGHAQVKPAPAAMVSNEMCCDIVDHLVLTSKDMLLLTEGTNDIRTSDRFLHVGTPWCVNALANFMQLDISVEVRLRNFAHDLSCLTYFRCKIYSAKASTNLQSRIRLRTLLKHFV